MKSVRKPGGYAGLILATCVLGIMGCSSKPLVVGQPRDAVPVEEVAVYFAERPDCDIETVAHLKMENPYYSLQSLVLAMRLQAAELGAELLIVEQTRRMPGREYVGTGRAVNCAAGREV